MEAWELKGDLGRFFPVDAEGHSLHRGQYTDDEVREISRILQNNGKENWSKLARTYTVLRISESRSSLDHFIKSGLTDFSIPYRRENLPLKLTPGAKKRFETYQVKVMTNIASLQQGLDGRHLWFKSFPQEEFETKGVLGEGGCGRVEKIFSRPCQSYYAMKLVKRSKVFGKDQKALDSFIRELSTTKKVRHRHVIQVVFSFTDKYHVGIIMKTIADCDLATFLDSALDYDMLSLLRTFYGCLISGLIAIQGQDIRHKDIKPRNILIRGKTALYTDFGIALDYSQVDHSTTTGRPVMFTEQYCPPEVVKWNDRKSSSDIFSLALVFLEMATKINGETVTSFRNFLDSEIPACSNCYSNCLPKIQRWINENLRAKSGNSADKIPLDWILKGLAEEPNDRPTVSELWDMMLQDTAKSGASFCCSDCSCDDDDDDNDDDDEESTDTDDDDLETLGSSQIFRFNTDSSSNSQDTQATSPGPDASTLPTTYDGGREWQDISSPPGDVNHEKRGSKSAEKKRSGESKIARGWMSVTGPTFHNTGASNINVSQNVARGDLNVSHGGGS